MEGPRENPGTPLGALALERGLIGREALLAQVLEALVTLLGEKEGEVLRLVADPTPSPQRPGRSWSFWTGCGGPRAWPSFPAFPKKRSTTSFSSSKAGASWPNPPLNPKTPWSSSGRKAAWCEGSSYASWRCTATASFWPRTKKALAASCERSPEGRFLPIFAVTEAPLPFLLRTQRVERIPRPFTAREVLSPIRLPL